MLDSFLEAIGRIGIFMICARAIVHFRPKESDEKYMKLLVSIMILIQLFVPFGSLFLGDGGSETAAALEQFKDVLRESMLEAEESAARADALLEEMTLEEVRKRVEEQEAKEQEAKEQEAWEINIKVDSVDRISVGEKDGR